MTIVTLYVDVENLLDKAQQVITSTIEEWPSEFPKPNILQLYVDADQTHVWEIWASHKFPSINTRVNGVQRYSSVTKNSADMSLITNALADQLKGRTSHTAILSDDSDYIALFTALMKEIPRNDKNDVPFIWFITDRPDTHSRTLNSFIPPQYLRCIKCGDDKKTPLDIKEKVVIRTRQVASDKKKVNPDERKSEIEQIVIAIIQDIPIGPFKSADCKKIIKKHFPNNQLSLADNATFGNQFAKNIWPGLEKRGVLLPNPNKKPRKYEMTDGAKKTITH